MSKQMMILVSLLLAFSCGNVAKKTVSKSKKYYLEIDCSLVENGWYAVIFSKNPNCDSLKESTKCVIEKNGFTYTKICFLNKDIVGNYFFYDNSEQRDNLNDSIGSKRILSCFLSSFGKFKALNFYVGENSNKVIDLSISSQEYFEFEEKLDEFIKNIKQ